MTSLHVRPACLEDLTALEVLYPSAFPQEDLIPVVRALHAGPDSIAKRDVLALVAARDGGIVGHVAFTPCRVGDRDEPVSLLAPLAVAPALQRQGIGSRLVADGLDRLREAGVAVVLVLGDPAYYARFGFTPETAILPPYPLPEAFDGAWRSLRLDASTPAIAGRLVVPPPWTDERLWTG